jgi:hypothetical protein
MQIRKNQNDRKKINKSTALLAEVPCTLKESTSLCHPVMQISKSVLPEGWAQANYAFIEDFGGRYYFIDDVIAATGGIMEFYLTVDPLMTYAGQIMGTSFQIARSEDLNSVYYVDTEKPIQACKFVEKHILGHIPQDLTGNKYTITVAGGV